MQAVIKAIEYHLPERSLTNSQLVSEFPEWTTEKIEEKIGIAERRIAAQDECSSDLGVAAAQRLFSSGACPTWRDRLHPFMHANARLFSADYCLRDARSALIYRRRQARSISISAVPDMCMG